MHQVRCLLNSDTSRASHFGHRSQKLEEPQWAVNFQILNRAAFRSLTVDDASSQAA